MPNSAGGTLGDALHAFLKEFPRDLALPIGAEVGIPSAPEVSFLEILTKHTPLPTEEVAAVRAQIDRRQAYDLLVFALRMAVHAARTRDVSVLRIGMLAIMLDDDLLDWRDVLVGLSIVEDCARRIGIDIPDAMQHTIDLATNRRRKLIDDYLSRPRELRELAVMSVAASGEGKELTYVHLPWR